MSNDKKNVFVENMQVLLSPDGMQKYLFGSKKDGSPRAVYDIVKDFTKPKKKHKKKKGKKITKGSNSFEFYLNSKGDKKKHKKKKGDKKKNKYWHI